MKKIVIACFAAVLALASAAWAQPPANGVNVNEKGSSGVCVAVTTSSVVQVTASDTNAVSLTFITDQAMNCMPGDFGGNEAGTPPTTGAIGTGAGIPIAAGPTTFTGDRSIPTGGMSLGATYNIPLVGNRWDCIAQTTNGHVCTVRTY